jgi:hypothetical protein
MHDSPHSKISSQSSSLWAAVTRLFWMFLGSGILIGLGLYIAFNTGKSVLVPSCLYWLNIVLMILVRFIDIRFLSGQTIDGEPATMQNWKRYAITLSVVAAVLWVGAFGLSHLKIL